MTHALLKSREFGVTDEGTNVNFAFWDASRVSAEWDTERQILAHGRDGLRKLGLMAPRMVAGRPDRAKNRALACIMLRWLALPGTSGYIAGGTHAGELYHQKIYSGENYGEFLGYHLEVLAELGTLPFCDRFAYAPDLESFGKGIELESRKAVQAQFVEDVRKKYPGLAIILTANGYGTTEDVLAYGAMPAEGTILRWAFYDPFPATHGPVRELRQPLPYPCSKAQAEAVIGGLELVEWKRAEIRAAIGYGRAQMREACRKIRATGLPVLCQEAGFHRWGTHGEVYAARWFADFKAACYSEGIPWMAFAAGLKNGGGGAFHLGVGLDPNDVRNQQGRAVAGLN